MRAPSSSPNGKSDIARGVGGGEGRAFNLVLHLQGPDGPLEMIFDLGRSRSLLKIFAPFFNLLPVYGVGLLQEAGGAGGLCVSLSGQPPTSGLVSAPEPAGRWERMALWLKTQHRAVQGHGSSPCCFISCIFLVVSLKLCLILGEPAQILLNHGPTAWKCVSVRSCLQCN